MYAVVVFNEYRLELTWESFEPYPMCFRSNKDIQKFEQCAIGPVQM